MGNELEEFQLGDRCLVQSSKRIFAKEYIENGIPFFRSKDVIDKSLGVFTNYDLYISEERYLEIKEKHGSPKKGDLLISSVGNRSGQPYIVQDEGDFYFKDGNILWLSQFNRIAPDYLAYWLKSRIGKYSLDSIMIGSAQKALTIDAVKKLWVSFPGIEIQEAAVGILGSLDDKIELNRQMNATLEAIAQAVFKSWFVDFDPVIDNALAAGNPIPEPFQARAAARKALGDQRKLLPEVIQKQFCDRFVFNEDMGWIPEGWEVSSLTDLIEILGGGTPKTSVPEYWDGDIPWFAVVDAPNPADIFVIDTSKHISPIGLKNSTAKLLPAQTTIISARGTVGKCAMTARSMAMNQSCYGIRGRGKISNFFTYYIIIDSVARLQQRSHGSVFNTITRDTLKTIKIPFSGAGLTQVFESVSSSQFKRVLQNNLQAQSLTQLRDTLLPKLLSGQLRIPDAEALVAEAL